jgi:hypothetical protein
MRLSELRVLRAMRACALSLSGFVRCGSACAQARSHGRLLSKAYAVRLPHSALQHTQSLFGPAGLAFMRMAAHMDHVGHPMKLLYGQNGHGGAVLCMRSAFYAPCSRSAFALRSIATYVCVSGERACAVGGVRWR